MRPPRLVAITGHSRHGKDTIADYLIIRYGYAKYSLAAPLKAAACAMFGWSPDALEGGKDTPDARYGISPRQVLQALGTEFGQFTLCEMFPEFARVTGRKLWVRSLLARCQAEPLAVISDLRFPHEAEEVRAAGGYIIKVRRPWPVDLGHESEAAIAEVREDIAVENDSTIAALDAKRLEMEAEQKYFEDRASARDMYKADNSLQKVYAMTFLVGYILLTGVMLYFLMGWIGAKEVNVPDWAVALISSIYGALSAKVGTVTDFYFGSSQGSREKDELKIISKE
jgi:hypothetical protein